MTREAIEEAVQDFRVTNGVGLVLDDKDLLIEFSSAPHVRPSTLPISWMAVYAFGVEDRCLKVGKVGPNSSARYTSQHYNPNSARSTLAASVLKHVEKGEERLWPEELPTPTMEDVGAWLVRHAWRANVLIRADQPRRLLDLLEGFLQRRFDPAFEGSWQAGVR